MQCLTCGKELGRNAATVRNFNGTPRKVSFCCHQHYIDFWAGATGFVPLPEYKKE